MTPTIRHRRQEGERCGNCISFTRGAQPLIDKDPMGTCDCGPPTSTAIPKMTGQDLRGQPIIDFDGVTKWPVTVRSSWWCGQWQLDPEKDTPLVKPA